MAIVQTRAGNEREYEFTRQDFERIRALIHSHAGISLADSKRDMVYSRLARQLRATGLRTFKDYLARLENGGGRELQEFTNSLTTNLTAFFREAHHFPVLADYLAGIKPKRAVSIWCCAASTGEEPYSIAMTAADVFGGSAPQVRILATDVDTTVLAHGQEGIYTLDRLDKVPAPQVRKYFQKGTGARSGFARVRPALQSMISFRQLNLLDAQWPFRGPFDVIFCRNVMIYFDKPTQYRILQRFVPLLRPEGLLFAGHSESFSHATDLFRLRGKTVLEPVRRGGA